MYKRQAIDSANPIPPLIEIPKLLNAANRFANDEETPEDLRLLPVSYTHLDVYKRQVYMRTTPPLPLPVKRALLKLGGDIKDARLRRRISTVTMAERAFITRMTLSKAENGDPTVSMGTYATLLYLSLIHI